MTSDQFLDEAILEMAKGGPRETWKLGVVDGPAWREDRDTWAARVVDDALALAAEREMKLLEIEAGELLARREAPSPPPDDPDFYVDCPKCEAERRKSDALDSDLTKIVSERDKLRSEIAAVAAVVGLTKRDIVMPGPAPDPEREHLSRQIVQSTDDRMMASTPGAALDAEADALRVECGGIFSWDDIGKGAQNDWRAVALKAREMHRKTASLSECADVFYGEGLRAVLQHLGVEVTP